jgi:hypothetical protein
LDVEAAPTFEAKALVRLLALPHCKGTGTSASSTALLFRPRPSAEGARLSKMHVYINIYAHVF